MRPTSFCRRGHPPRRRWCNRPAPSPSSSQVSSIPVGSGFVASLARPGRIVASTPHWTLPIDIQSGRSGPAAIRAFGIPPRTPRRWTAHRHRPRHSPSTRRCVAIRCGRCARAVGGQAAAAPPSRVMNSRRLIGLVLGPRTDPTILAGRKGASHRRKNRLLMSESGQTEKNSLRANVVRVAPERWGNRPAACG